MKSISRALQAVHASVLIIDSLHCVPPAPPIDHTHTANICFANPSNFNGKVEVQLCNFFFQNISHKVQLNHIMRILSHWETIWTLFHFSSLLYCSSALKGVYGYSSGKVGKKTTPPHNFEAFFAQMKCKINMFFEKTWPASFFDLHNIPNIFKNSTPNFEMASLAEN